MRIIVLLALFLALVACRAGTPYNTAARPTPAVEGPARAQAETLDRGLGRGNGYILEWRDRSGTYRVCWTGDSVLSAESQTLSEQHGPIDLLLPHMGGVGGDGGLGLRTMNAEEAIRLVQRVQPGLVIPIHHTTFAQYREPIEALQQRAEQSGLARLFRFVREGQSLTLSAASNSSGH